MLTWVARSWCLQSKEGSKAPSALFPPALENIPYHHTEITYIIEVISTVSTSPSPHYFDVLRDRDGEGDRAKAVVLLDESLAISNELGIRPLMERVLSRREILKA